MMTEEINNYQHTPPPWFVFEGNGEARGQSWISVTTINENVSKRIATLESGEYWSDEHRANVRLISLSPELLEVLDELTRQLSDDWISEHSELYEKAIELIAKMTLKS